MGTRKRPVYGHLRAYGPAEMRVETPETANSGGRARAMLQIRNGDARNRLEVGIAVRRTQLFALRTLPSAKIKLRKILRRFGSPKSRRALEAWEPPDSLAFLWRAAESKGLKTGKRFDRNWEAVERNCEEVGSQNCETAVCTENSIP